LIQIKAGGSLVIPCPEEKLPDAAEVSLMEKRGGANLRLVPLPEKVTAGYLIWKNLPAGSYSLFVNGVNKMVRIHPGETIEGHVLTPSTTLQLTANHPVTVNGFEAAEIKLADGKSAPLCKAAFAECDGLEMTQDFKTIRSGGANDHAYRVPGVVNYSNLTLKRGVTDSFDLWTWFADSIADPFLRANAEVVMFAEDGSTERARFQLSRCIPAKIKAPSLNAKDGTIAIEEYPLDLFSPFWETAVYGGGSVRVAYTGEYPQGIDPHGFHIWQMDENGTLVGGIKQSFPVFNGSYAAIARDGAISYLPGLGGISSNALAINGRGEIAGWAQDSASNQVHLVIWRPRSTLLAATGR
jgi:phage tail-like protein